MQILENVYLEQLLEIFDENNQDYVSDRKCILNDDFLKIVAVDGDKALGYMVFYLHDDFILQEEYPVKVKVNKNSIYIWHAITRKGSEGKGVQTAIFNYARNKFKNCDIYSVYDKKNISTIFLHNKLGFQKVTEFQKSYNGKLGDYILVVNKAQ